MALSQASRIGYSYRSAAVVGEESTIVFEIQNDLRCNASLAGSNPRLAPGGDFEACA
jgi:hypothetical protein